MFDARITPRMYIDYVTKQRWITTEELGVAPIVVVSWWSSVISSLAKTAGAELCNNWISKNDKLYTLKSDNQHVSFMFVPVSAAATVMVMEELIAAGAKKFIGIGWAGSLQSELPVGSLIMPTSCISEEGTSRHYVDEGTELVPDKNLMEAILSTAKEEGVAIAKGPQWTTDAPYRELVSTIKAYSQQGVLGVDMETSAMFALGLHRQIPVCNILTVSDELWQEWNPAFDSNELREGTNLAKSLVLKYIEKIAS